MITIGSNGQKIAYGIKHYNLDNESDLQEMPKTTEAVGCTCFVIETSKYYMLNSAHQWIEISPFGKSINNNGGDIEDPSDDIIYEGGVV